MGEEQKPPTWRHDLEWQMSQDGDVGPVVAVEPSEAMLDQANGPANDTGPTPIAWTAARVYVGIWNDEGGGGLFVSGPRNPPGGAMTYDPLDGLSSRVGPLDPLRKIAEATEEAMALRDQARHAREAADAAEARLRRIVAEWSANS